MRGFAKNWFPIALAILWVVMAIGFLIAAATVPEASFDNPNPGPSGIGALMMFITWLVSPAYYVLLEGRPDLSRHGCKARGIQGHFEYWDCPALVTSRPGA